MRRIKYFTKDTLVLANNVAIKTNRNRTLHPHKLAELPDDYRFPIGFSFPHNDHEMRVSIAVGTNARDPRTVQVVWLDIPFETYGSLPECEVED